MENEKKFAAPEIEIIHLDGSDIITNDSDDYTETELDPIPDKN